jgi:methylase of polypeptide subunit release factors
MGLRRDLRWRADLALRRGSHRQSPLDERPTSDAWVPSGQDSHGASLLIRSLPDQLKGSVMDLGAGDGRIGIAAGDRGADEVILVERNALRASEAERNLKRSGYRGSVLSANYFDDVPFEKVRVTTVVSNPPQLPSMSRAVGGCNFGGRSGFSHFRRVIELAGAHTVAGGTIYLHVLGFLPIRRNEANSVTIEQILDDGGYGSIDVVHLAHIPVRREGAISFQIRHILSLYGSDAFAIGCARCRSDQVVDAIRLGDSVSVSRFIVRATKR